MTVSRFKIAILLLPLVGCASAPPIETSAIEGGPGQPISVAIADVESGTTPTDRVMTPDLPPGQLNPAWTRQYVIHLEVSNNSGRPVTVMQINIARASTANAFQIDPAFQKVNEMIDPGKDHIFDVPVQGRQVRPFHPDESQTVEFRVVIALQNGDSYFYTFERPIR